MMLHLILSLVRVSKIWKPKLMNMNSDQRPSIMSSLKFQLLELARSTRFYTKGPKISMRYMELNLIGQISMQQSLIKKMMKNMQPRLTMSRMRNMFHQ